MGKSELEVELTAKLQEPGIPSCRDLAGGTRVRTRERRSRRWRREVFVDGSPLCMVEDVISLEAQLNPGIFGEVEVLEQ